MLNPQWTLRFKHLVTCCRVNTCSCSRHWQKCAKWEKFQRIIIYNHSNHKLFKLFRALFRCLFLTFLCRTRSGCEITLCHTLQRKCLSSALGVTEHCFKHFSSDELLHEVKITKTCFPDSIADMLLWLCLHLLTVVTPYFQASRSRATAIGLATLATWRMD